ncbi:lysophospholipid acyltransferase family protein [Hwanghaeella sp.]|uniref:lysophospholipid acyltransferase family protein n=1 Tax=Hwanghaeella sp. TaxID=2605943 RepID=UPI003CCB83FE
MTVRGILFGIYFYLLTTFVVIAYLPFLLTTQRIVRFLAGLWCRAALFGLRVIGGVSWRYEGVENLPDRPFVLACKHQSTWETLSLFIYFDAPAFILKQELTKIPLFGWYLHKAGNISVDRSAGAKALRKMIEDTRQVLGTGRKIVIFPEGTRTAPGTKPRYHSGVVAVYRESGYPLVPAALNSGQFWPKSIWSCRPGEIVLRFLPPLPEDMGRRELMTSLEEVIETASRDLQDNR